MTYKKTDDNALTEELLLKLTAQQCDYTLYKHEDGHYELIHNLLNDIPVSEDADVLMGPDSETEMLIEIVPTTEDYDSLIERLNDIEDEDDDE